MAERFLNSLKINSREYEHIKNVLKREPNEFELHLFGATYCEHCAYKHSKELLKLLPRKNAVFYDENAGGIRIGEHVILFKMESHNHPCAVEPFNGAATGIGGIIRDVLTMNARPIALCNSLKFGNNKHIQEGVVAGISNYGNSIGVPTISTEVLQGECFNENPLVNVTAIGIAKFENVLTSHARAGLRLMLVGSHTAKDGLNGASFASKELEGGKKEDKLSIQIANPFLKKKLIEACLEIFAQKLVIASQDCGAAGVLSSTSEIAFKSGCGVELDLSKVHVADCTIEDYEIMLSETQERMLFVVEQEKIEAIEKILKKYELGHSIIGKTIEEKSYIVKSANTLLANIPSELLVTPPSIKIDFSSPRQAEPKPTIKDINSPHIYEQYDHTVGNRTVSDPFDNPNFNTLWIYEEDCYLGVYTFCAFDDVDKKIIEAGNFLKQKGFAPMGLTNCLNFTNPEIPPTMFEFRKTILGIKKACESLEIPVCSGNVSFYNESGNSKIVNAPTFTMLGVKK